MAHQVPKISHIRRLDFLQKVDVLVGMKLGQLLLIELGHFLQKFEFEPTAPVNNMYGDGI
jgi:hypothetical protein